MKEQHLTENELALLEDGACTHLAWCHHCRNVVAEYAWLQEDLSSTLTTVAEQAPVPRPNWSALVGRLSPGGRWHTSGFASALASVMVLIGLLLSVPNALGSVAAERASDPPVFVAAAPSVTAGSAHLVGVTLTPAPALVTSTVSETRARTPACVLPPMPPTLSPAVQ